MGANGGGKPSRRYRAFDAEIGSDNAEAIDIPFVPRSMSRPARKQVMRPKQRYDRVRTGVSSGSERERDAQPDRGLVTSVVCSSRKDLSASKAEAKRERDGHFQFEDPAATK